MAMFLIHLSDLEKFCTAIIHEYEMLASVFKSVCCVALVEQWL